MMKFIKKYFNFKVLNVYEWLFVIAGLIFISYKAIEKHGSDPTYSAFLLLGSLEAIFVIVVVCNVFKVKEHKAQ